MPRREVDPTSRIHNYNKYSVQDWGIDKQKDPTPEFPGTIHSVADAAFEAIAGTLYGKQRFDPNLASNAMASNTIFDYRPTISAHNSGRIGIEIDSASFLTVDDHSNSDHINSHDPRGHYSYESNGSAMRRLILVLAGKLSNYPWGAYELDGGSETARPDTIGRPLVVYFNTVKQALAASRQLQVLQRQETEILDHHPENNHKHQHQQRTSSYGNITILSLGQDDELPANSFLPKVDGGKQKAVDPSRGIVIVVQPTDFNDEYRPPGPALGVLASFQKLVARASMEKLPVIMVSPRFLAKEDPFGTGAGRGWDQSAGSHQAATYGGMEPPNGPVPWILRDFTPPIYCWVANAATLDAKERYYMQSQHSLQHRDGVQFPYSQVALSQSVMNEGHPWHLFAAKRDTDAARSKERILVYDYLASTKSGSGRPTQEIMRYILREFAERS